MLGLPTDPPLLDGEAVLADLGAKSPVVTTDTRFIIVGDTLTPGSADTVRLDVTGDRAALALSSRATRGHLPLARLPEAACFSRPVFGSTRVRTSGPRRVRITYSDAVPLRDSVGAPSPPLVLLEARAGDGRRHRRPSSASAGSASPGRPLSTASRRLGSGAFAMFDPESGLNPAAIGRPYRP